MVDELRRPPLGEALDIQASITVVDPASVYRRQYRRHPIYRDQIELADVLAASKADLADAATLAAFQGQSAVSAQGAHRSDAARPARPAWLSLPARPAPLSPKTRPRPTAA